MQVGHKGMRYMQLHAEAVLDLVERAPREVQFRAVSGDFKVLQGKFIVSQPMEARLPRCSGVIMGLQASICVFWLCAGQVAPGVRTRRSSRVLAACHPNRQRVALTSSHGTLYEVA